jgi:K+-transporting ATPase ATPase A chain
MTPHAWLTLGLYLAVLLALAYPLAIYVARIGNPAPIRGIVGRFERVLYRSAGVDPAQDMPWTRYAVAVLLFNALGVLVVFCP